LRTELEYVQDLVADIAAGRVDWEPVVTNSRMDSGDADKEHA
jgi:hypothetical protein